MIGLESIIPVGRYPLQRDGIAGRVNALAATTGVPTIGVHYLIPQLFPRGVVIDRLAIGVTAFAASATVSLSIFDTRADALTTGRNIEPHRLRWTTAGISAAGSNGRKAVALRLRLPAGLYWFDYFGLTASPTVACLAVGSMWPLLGHSASSGTAPGVGFTEAFTTTLVPGTFAPDALIILDTVPIPAIYYHVAEFI